MPSWLTPHPLLFFLWGNLNGLSIAIVAVQHRKEAEVAASNQQTGCGNLAEISIPKSQSCSEHPILPQFRISLKRGYLQILTSHCGCCCLPLWLGLFNCFPMNFLCRQWVHFAYFAPQQRDKLSIACRGWEEKVVERRKIEERGKQVREVSVYISFASLYLSFIYTERK